MGVFKSLFKFSLTLISLIAIILGLLYQFVPKRFEFVMERKKFHPWLLSPIIYYRQDCKSPERVPTENCSCPYGYFDDGVNDECQICPYPAINCDSGLANQLNCENSVYISFDHLIPDGAIEELDDFLLNEMKIYENNTGKFYARGKVHGGSVGFTQYERYNNITSAIGFKGRRLLKMSNIYHPRSELGKQYQKVFDLIDKMDIFEYTGESGIIISPPGQSGIMHRDHISKDLVSEFIWIRGNRLKQFHVWEPEQKRFDHFTSFTGFFDDTEEHNTFEVPEYSYSIRINGKFKPHIRQYIADNYSFIYKEYRRQVFLDNEFNLKQDYTGDERFDFPTEEIINQ